MENVYRMSFPRKIDMFHVSEYMKEIEKYLKTPTVIFDLRETIDIHSSFMGFLLVIKNRVERNGGRLQVEMSPYIRRVMDMLGMADYFVYDCADPLGNEDPGQAEEPAPAVC